MANPDLPAELQNKYQRQRGYLLRRLGRTEEALADFETIINRFPNDANGFNGRALMMQDQGKIDIAENDFKEALRRSPSATHIWINLANLYMHRAKDYRQAAAALTAAIIAEQSPEFQAKFARDAESFAQDTDTDLDADTILAALPRTTYPPHAFLAEAYLRQGDMWRGKPALERALKVGTFTTLPHSIACMYLVAQAGADGARKKCEEVEAQHKRRGALGPYPETVYTAIAYFRWADGDLDAARANLAEARLHNISVLSDEQIFADFNAISDVNG